MGVRNFLTFFPAYPWRSDRPTDFDAKWLKRRAFTQGWYFCSKNRYFSYPLISRAPKRSKFRKFLDLGNFSLDLVFNIRGHGENTPYSSSKPNESGIVNRQSGGEKLKYILKFYIGGTCHVISRLRNDDLALCLWAYGVWGTISRNPLEIETWVKRTTDRKWPIGIRMVTWLMTSHEPQRSRSWPQYIWDPLSRQRLEIETWVQWTTNRKWPIGIRMVTWLMTSRDPERSRSWPQYA